MTARSGGIPPCNAPWYYQATPNSTIEYKRETLERFAEQFIVPLAGF